MFITIVIINVCEFSVQIMTLIQNFSNYSQTKNFSDEKYTQVRIFL